MLDDLQRQHDVVLPAACRQGLGGVLAIVDGEALLPGMQGGDGDVAGAGVDAGNGGAEPGHGFAEQAAAAADVEDGKALQRTARQRLAAPMDGRAVADIADTNRAQAMQRRELAGGVPPLVGDARKALDLGRIDGRGGRWRGRTVRRLVHGCA